VRRFSGSACNKGSGYSLTRPYSVGAANVRAGHHDGYVHCGNVHENQPSSPSDGYFRRLLTLTAALAGLILVTPIWPVSGLEAGGAAPISFKLNEHAYQ